VGEYSKPLPLPEQEALARELADAVWHFGQTGESELVFARRFLTERGVGVLRQTDAQPKK
jgi:hypothetical protein